MGRFAPHESLRVTNAITDLILSLTNNHYYSAGRSFTRTFMATERFKATARLWFFSVAPSGNYVTCSVSPDHSTIASSTGMQQEYWKIFRTVYDTSQLHGYGSMMVVSKLLAIQYISWPGKISSSSGNAVAGNGFGLKSSDSHEIIGNITVDDLYPTLGDCWPYTTSMISGYQTAGSFEFAPYIFRSKNNRYEAFMRSNCNLALYEPVSYSIKPKLVCGTNDLYAYCSISLQVDSNMIIAKNYKAVVKLFTSDKYCKPQPDCVRTAGLSVEDDGYIVVWDTDKQTALWREPRKKTIDLPNV